MRIAQILDDVVRPRLEHRGRLDAPQRLGATLGRVREQRESEQVGVAGVMRVFGHRALGERHRVRRVDEARKERNARQLGVQAREQPQRAALLDVRIERKRAQGGLVHAARDPAADRLDAGPPTRLQAPRLTAYQK